MAGARERRGSGGARGHAHDGGGGCRRRMNGRDGRRAQAGPLVDRRGLGLEVVECPLIEIERTSDEPIDCAGYEWLIVTSPNGATRSRVAAGTCRRSPRSGPGRPSGCARTRSSPTSSRASPRRTASSPSSRDRPGVSSSPRPRTRGGGPSTRSGPTSSRSTGRGSSRRGRRRATSSFSPRARPRARSRGPAPTCRRSRSARRRRGRASVGLTVVVEAETHDLDGLVAAVDRVARGDVAVQLRRR